MSQRSRLNESLLSNRCTQKFSQLKGLITDQTQLREFLQTEDAEELSKIICSKICSGDFLKILDSVLQVCNSTEALQVKRKKLVESLLVALSTAKLSANHLDEIINRIVIDFPHYPKTHLVKLVDFCVSSIHKNEDESRSWKDLLPILLEVLEEEKYINHMNAEVSGKEYKSLIIKSICNGHWEPDILPPLTKMFGDMSLEKEDHDLVLRTLSAKLSSIALNEVPPFVHQALRFCSNQDCRLLLETLRRYFATSYEKAISDEDTDSIDTIGALSAKEVRDVESTVLYHIHQAAQLNHKSMKDFVRFLRNITPAPEYVLEPFMLAVLSLISGVFEDQVFEILQLTINRKLQEDEKRKHVAWLRPHLSDTQDVMSILERVIDNSSKDRHLVLKGLVDTAFVLLDTEQKTKTEVNSYQIGSQLLQKLMRKRHDIGAAVLQKLIDRIVGGGSAISEYTDCLTYMCRKLTMTVLDSQAWIVTLLDQLSSIPGETGIEILYAILPLIRVSAGIRNTLILVLRKILHGKGIAKRRMAVAGFLELLKSSKTHTTGHAAGELMSSSDNTSSSILTQVTLERSSQRSYPGYTKSLCYDILNILKKCFSHECEVRLSLYEGLYEVIVKNPEITDDVLEMLMSHFNCYFEENENVLPPLKLDLCTDVQGVEVILHEPIAELIYALYRIYIKSATRNSMLVDKIAIILESLCRRVSQIELEHLNVDEDTDLLDNVPKAQQKLQSLKLMLMIYETLMAYRIETWSAENPDIAQNVYELYKGYNRLLDFLKRVGKSNKKEGRNKKDKDPNNSTIKKSTRPAAIKLPNSMMNLNAIHKILSLLYTNSVPWSNKNQTIIFRSYKDFHRYILQTCGQLLRDTKSLKNRDLRKHETQYKQAYLEIGNLLYTHPLSELGNTDIDEQATILALESFKDLCDLMCTSFPSLFPQFIDFICETDSSADINSQLQSLISSFRTYLKKYLNMEIDSEDVHKKRILVLLLEVIEQFVHKMTFQEVKTHKVFEWIQKLAQKDNIDSALSMSILRLLLWVEERCKEYGETAYDICLEICGKLGTIDEEELTKTEVFTIIQDHNGTEAYNILSTHIKDKLNDASWFLARLKSEQSIISIPGMDEEKRREQLRQKERSFCKQLSFIIQILQTLGNISISPGQSTDFMFRNLQLLYNLLNNLTKYFHSKSSSQNPAFQTVHFIQVVEGAGKALKYTFYKLVTHTEENQNKSRSKTKSDTFAQRNKILKETKVIPRVVYEIEQFNKAIMLLAKKTGVPLESYIKHSVTRDFRIKNPQLVEGLEKLNVSMLNTQNPEETRNDTLDTSEENNEDSSPSRKRPRLS